MNGSVPANVNALVKQAEAGAELACRAYTKELAEDGSIVRRGVISHYAAAAWPAPTTWRTGSTKSSA